MVLLLASCAPKQGIIVLEEPPVLEPPVMPVVQEKFSLPEPPPEAEEPVKEEPKKALPDLEAVLVDEEDGKYIILNFENTDIKTINSTFGELLEINYILTPGITGSVTIQSYKKIPVRNLFEVFQSILETNGLTAIKDGDFYKIIPIDLARTFPLDIEAGDKVKMQLDSSFVTQLVSLVE